MKVVILHNIKAGSARGKQELRELFSTYSIDVVDMFSIGDLESKKLRKLASSGCIIAAIGGDGTLNSAARLVVGTKSVLLPLPGGTFNHFVRDSKMAPSIEGILQNISKAKEKSIDVAYVNDELFLNNSNIGMYPFSLIERKTTRKIIGKWAAAVLSAFDQLAIFRRHHLIVNGTKVTSPFIFVGNNEYKLDAALIPQRTRINQGKLCVMVSTSASRRELIHMASSVLFGSPRTRDDFLMELKKSVTIESKQRRLSVSFDGEVKKLPTPLRYTIKPKALRILHVPLVK